MPRQNLPITSATSEVAGACPLDCPDCCSWLVTVENGVATGLRGNREHPVTRGTLCVKVNRYLEQASHRDRILHPMRRVGAKGEGRFERIGWDEALDEMADRLSRIVDEHGGEALWPYQGTGALGYLQGVQGRAGTRLWNVLGASHHDMTICSIAGLTGLTYALGTSRGMDPEDFALSKLTLLWGTNTLTSGHHLWRFIEAGRKNGGHVVAIDPMRTRTAAAADEHLAPMPGTDGALALGLMHVIVASGREDDDFLSRYCFGWEDFRERVLAFTPERAASITGVPAEQIRDLGERIARTRPTAIRTSQGVQRHAGAGATLRTLACIPAVTGDWHRPGGGLMFSTDTYFGGNREALFRDDLRPKAVRTLSMTRLAEGLLEASDPPVMGLVVYGANPVVSTSDQNRVRAGLSRKDLYTVVLEHFPTDTVDYADLVLPATMQHEHTDLMDAYGHLYLAWNERAVEPPGECRSTTDTFRDLAARMGLREPSLYDSDERLAEQLLDSDHPSLHGITLDGLRAGGWARLNYPSPLAPFEHGFPTPSGKFEFVSATAAADGLDPMPGYTPPLEVVDDEMAARHPFVLIAGASHFAINTIFGNNDELRRRAGSPTVVVHPDDALAHGLATGTLVRVFNRRGEFTADVLVDARVRRGVLSTTKGHWLKLTGGATVNATVDERDADMGGGAVFHDNRVSVEAVEVPAAQIRGGAST
ncbi:molybdopterin-containing oxidoreductase family protein [Lentzea chajnantorensis]